MRLRVRIADAIPLCTVTDGEVWSADGSLLVIRARDRDAARDGRIVAARAPTTDELAVVADARREIAGARRRIG